MGRSLAASHVNANDISWWGKTAVLVGDSTMAGGNFTKTIAGSAISGDGTTVTVTAESHGRWPGGPVFIGGANDNRFNGAHTVDTVPDSSHFTYKVSASKSFASPATDSSSTVQILGDEKQTDRNFFQIANWKNGSPFGQVVNRAVSGTTTTKQRARFSEDVLSLNPDLVVLMGFTNDIRADQTFATITTNIRAMCEQALAAGVLVILCTSTPFDSAATGYSTTRLDTFLAVNTWIRNYCARTPGVHLLDVFLLCTDGTNATGNWRSNYSIADKVHPSNLAAQRIAASSTPAAQDLSTLLASIAPTLRRVNATCIRDDRNITSAATNYAYNPLMQGASGTLLGTVSGAAPNSWTVTNGSGPAVAASVAASADGIGNDLILSLGGSGTGAIDVLGTGVHSIVSAGDVFELSAHLQGATLAGITYIALYIDSTFSGLSFQAGSFYPSGSTPSWADDFDLMIVCPRITIPAGGASLFRPRLQISVGSASSAVIKLGQVALRKIVE
jgi:lysophospholipase L1-like esterase